MISTLKSTVSTQTEFTSLKTQCKEIIYEKIDNLKRYLLIKQVFLIRFYNLDARIKS